MSQTYMTAKLNLTDGTIVYPQVSLDNVVNSIDDPTLATIATGISISVNGGTATLVTNGGSGVAKFVGANGLVVSMNEGNEVVFTAPTVSEVGSAAYADNAGSATHATSAGTADTLVSGYVVTSATNATSAGTAAAIASGAIVGGYKIEIISGNTIGQAKWFNIVNATGATVTVEPGEAYKINAANSAVTISATLGTVGQWGQEGHAEIFVAGTGNVHTGANVTLADGLEPDSVNNCTLRFHDGRCIISVEDHVAGYIVVNGSTAGDGSLYYGITTSTNDYVAFDASLNGTVIPLAGAVAEGEKHIVGNGYNETAISGAIDCSTAKVTVANLSLQDVGITGGTLTLGDAFIPSGSTVAVSGGGLEIEKVTGDGSGVIDLKSNCIVMGSNKTANIHNVTFVNGSNSAAPEDNVGAVLYAPSNRYATMNVVDTVFDGNPTTIAAYRQNTVNITGCTFRNKTGSNNLYIYLTDHNANLTMSNCLLESTAGKLATYRNNRIDITGCTFNKNLELNASGGCYLHGSNIFTGTLGYAVNLIITSGAILDLTGNANPTPIAPGGGITFAPGGATVYPSAGQASAYMLGGMTVPQLTNTNVVNLSGGRAVVGADNAYASNVTFSGGSATAGGGLYQSGTRETTLVSCSIVGNTAVNAGGGIYYANGVLHASYCTVKNNVGGQIYLTDAAKMDVTGGEYENVACAYPVTEFTINSGVATIGHVWGSGSVTISSGASINLTSSIIPGGGITVLTGGCTVNGVAVTGGTYTSIVSSGGSAVVS